MGRRDYGIPALDEDGFLVHPEQWNEIVAAELAERDGLGPLTEAHWRLLDSLRTYYLRTGAIPLMHHLCLVAQLEPEQARRLFHYNERALWRLAGLPNPGGSPHPAMH